MINYRIKRLMGLGGQAPILTAYRYSCQMKISHEYWIFFKDINDKKGAN